MSSLRTPVLLLVLALTLGGCLVRGPGLYLERDRRHEGGRERHEEHEEHERDEGRSDRR